jgi:predicted permease
MKFPSLFRRRKQREQELDEEINTHLAMASQERIERGENPAEAESNARSEFGNITLVKEVTRDIWGWRLLETLWQDMRYGSRQFRRNQGFTAVAVITLALGIGANTTIFSVINAVLLRPLPYPHPNRLVQIWETNHQFGLDREVVSAYNFIDWQRQSRDFAAMATYDYHHFSYTGGKLPVSLFGLRVSADFFRVLGVHPFLGRDFLRNEDQAGVNRVAILSYAAWQDYFGRNRQIVGTKITLDGEPYTVVGVMSADFRFPSPGIRIWTTPGFDLKKLTRSHAGIFAIGRMKPKVMLVAARTEMDTIAHRLALQYPDTNRYSGILLVPLREEIVGNVRFALLVLWGAVALVLLIASANVANLLLSRGVARQKEFAVRSALGGGRARILAQLLTESVLLAAIGGALGLIISRLGTGAIVQLAAIPRSHDISVNTRVLGFTALLIILTGIIFGLAPAFAAFSVDVISSIKESGSAVRPGLAGSRLRRWLVLGEIAVTLVLLAGAGLLIKSLWMIGRIDPGFNPKGVLAARMSLPGSEYPNGLTRSAVFRRVIERIAAIPGVEEVGGVNDLPFSGSRTSSSFDIQGMTPRSPQEVPEADYRTVSPGYFKAMGIPLLKGREFTQDDQQGTPDVAIINEALARKYWPGGSPLGQHLNLGDKLWEIAGVVGDVKLLDLTAKDRPEIYVPYLQAGSPPWMFFAVLSHADPASLIASVRKAAQDVVPDEPLYGVGAMQDRVEASTASRRLSALLLGIFAALALVLAAVGIYGVIAYAVEQSTHEIGIRMALGAQRGDILRMVVGEGLKLALVGVAIGIAGALALTRSLSSLLYGVKPTDPLTFGGVSLILTGVALLACYIPARRATKVDPMLALRYE